MRVLPGHFRRVRTSGNSATTEEHARRTEYARAEQQETARFRRSARSNRTCEVQAEILVTGLLNYERQGVVVCAAGQQSRESIVGGGLAVDSELRAFSIVAKRARQTYVDISAAMFKYTANVSSASKFNDIV